MRRECFFNQATDFEFVTLNIRFFFRCIQHDHFCANRNNHLKPVHNRAPPHPKSDLIPQLYHRKLGLAIIHNSLNSGAFGWVSIGVDFITGYPLAVTELRIRLNDHDLRSVENEVAISRRFVKVRVPFLLSLYFKFSLILIKIIVECYKPFRSGANTMKRALVRRFQKRFSSLSPSLGRISTNFTGVSPFPSGFLFSKIRS